MRRWCSRSATPARATPCQRKPAAQACSAGIQTIGGVEADREICAVVLQGDSAHFCAVGNLQRLQRASRQTPDMQVDMQADMAADGMAPNALASVKALLNAGPGHALREHLDAERTPVVSNLFHRNGAEGLQAFLDKRPPRYK